VQHYPKVPGIIKVSGMWEAENLYDADTREWGSTTSQGKDLRDVTYANFFRLEWVEIFLLQPNQHRNPMNI